jgi:hypothetical protein
MEQVKISQNMNFPKETYFRGLLFTRIEDNGPDITANFTNLDEGQVLSLSVQAFTLIGVGTGSRSSGSWVDNVFGPMPVPTGQLINSLIYPFLIDDQSSKDSRIRSAGRSCAIIILVSRQMKKYDEFRTYLINYLGEWVKQNKYSEENIKQLFYVVQKHQTLNAETDEKTNQGIELVGGEGDLKKLLAKQYVKISLLEHLVSLDSIGKALATMYDSNPEGGTIDQLSKMAGMSRIMMGWNLRKYVKAGLIQIENNNIFFLK